jgi:hypothetical protein
MKKTGNLINKMLVFSLVVIIAMGGATSCKSKKKIAREKAEAEYQAKVVQAKKDLTAILNDETNWTLPEKKERLATIKSYNIDNQEVKDLIVKVEEKLKDEERQLAEEREKRKEQELTDQQRRKYSIIIYTLTDIAKAKSYDEANQQIEGTLNLYATPDVPVLIIISKENGYYDYDRPTTISKFMNYLKDKKEFKYDIESVKYDDQGKITELELIKK